MSLITGGGCAFAIAKSYCSFYCPFSFLLTIVRSINIAWLFACSPKIRTASGDFDGDATVHLLRQNTPKDKTSEWLMSPGDSVGSFTFTPAG
jgi:hypothetical protein